MSNSKAKIAAERLFGRGEEEAESGWDKQTFLREIGGEDTRELRHLLASYQIRKELGEGTFGKVQLAVHIASKEKVAIKMLEKSKIVDEGDRQRISREIQILKILRHPNIVQLYEIIEDKTHLYLIMEYASGGELFDYIVSQQRVKELEASRFFQQLIDGIEYIYKLKIAHRDLKPENLLLDESNNIKIVDFGLSNLYKENQLLKTACGSPCYAAPEMIAGKAYRGLKVDLWSAGVILFALICGYLPFDDNDTQVLYKKIIRGEYSIPSFVSNMATDLIKRVLCTDPEKRLNIEQIKSHQWFNLFKGYANIPKGLIVGIHEVPVDERIVELVSQYGYERETIVQSVKTNRHNIVSTLYYLILRKMIKKEGHVSVADINSIFFKPKLLEKPELLSRSLAPEEPSAADVPAPRRQNSPEVSVSNVLEMHHDIIIKKSEKANIKTLNVTKLQPFEENLYSSAAGNNIPKRKDEPRDERRKANRTQVPAKQERPPTGPPKTDASQPLSKDPRDPKEVRASSSKPATGLKSAGAKKPAMPLKFNSRSPTPENHGSLSRNPREPAQLFKSLVAPERRGLAKPPKLGPSLATPDKFGSVQAPRPPVTARRSPAPKPAEEDPLKAMKVHRGPLNLNAVSMKNPSELLADISRALSELGVTVKDSRNFSLRCEFGELRFIVEINLVEKFTNIFVVKFYKNNQSNNNYFELCQNIFARLTL